MRYPATHKVPIRDKPSSLSLNNPIATRILFSSRRRCEKINFVKTFYTFPRRNSNGNLSIWQLLHIFGGLLSAAEDGRRGRLRPVAQASSPAGFGTVPVPQPGGLQNGSRGSSEAIPPGT